MRERHLRHRTEFSSARAPQAHCRPDPHALRTRRANVSVDFLGFAREVVISPCEACGLSGRKLTLVNNHVLTGMVD